MILLTKDLKEAKNFQMTMAMKIHHFKEKGGQSEVDREIHIM